MKPSPFSNDRNDTQVNRLIPTPQGVNPVGRNALPAPKRRAFIPLSDSSARKYKSELLYFARSTSPVKRESRSPVASLPWYWGKTATLIRDEIHTLALEMKAK